MKKFLVQAAWEDVPHLDAAGKAVLKSSYLPHELDARTKGIPSLGAGAIYPVPESDLVCDPFEFPLWYRHALGLDVGWNRTAAIWGALDPESDILYLYSEHYRGQAEPPIHAEAIKARGKWIPGAVDPAARGRSQKDGEKLLSIYQTLGLNLTKADNSVYSGLQQVWTRMSTGRLKVFRTLQYWLGEFRLYRRNEKGDIVKENDHLMDATRYLCMTGVDLATDVPYEFWPKNASAMRALPIKNVKRHQIDYQPFSAAWSVPQQQPLGNSQPYQPWMPHSGITR